MISYETAHRLAQLSGEVLSSEDLATALAVVTRTAVDAVDGCDGCSLTMREHGLPTASAADDDWARVLDAMQVEEQEGPCLDCMREATVMRVRDLAQDARFPSYGPRAAEHGARSAASFPLGSDGRTVGALNIYGREPDVFDTDTVALGTLLAAHASLALQAAQAYFSSRQLSDQLQQALTSRAVIEQAKGIVMATRRCDAEAAFALLVAQSQTANRKLRDVAGDLVASVAG